MRAWLYDTLTQSEELQLDLGAEDIKTRVVPRRSKTTVDINNLKRPFLIYGLGNATNQNLVDATADDPQDKNATGQFFEVWIHDSGGSFVDIDAIVEHVIKLLNGASSPANGVISVSYLETSAEFNNETYDTNFRYVRFQAMIVKGN